MAEIPFEHIAVSIDDGETYRLFDRPGAQTKFQIPNLSADGNIVPYIAALCGPKFTGSTLAALKAPTRVSDPTMTGTGTIGSTFTRQSPGVVTANPEATMDPPLWQMRADDLSAAQTIAGASGETFTVDDATFDVGNQIRTGTRFVNSQGEITLWSSWITVAEVPKITAVVDLQPATQVSSVTFNVAIKGSPTITQGQTIIASTQVAGTETWEFVAQVEGPLSITANQDGYQTFSANLTVSPAPAAHIRQENFTYINNATEPTAVTIATPDITTDTLDGTYSVPVASQAGTPIWASGPSLTRDAGDLVLDLGIIVTQDADLVSVDWTWPDLSTGLRMPEAGYEGTTVSVPINAVDSLGREATATASIAVPAIALAPGLTDLGFFVGTNTASGSTKNIDIDLGIADPTKLMIVATLWGPEPADATSKDQTSLKIVAGGVEYPANPKRKSIQTPNGRRLSLWDIPCPVGGAATLVVGGQITAYPAKAYVFAGKNVSFIAPSDTNKLGTNYLATGGTSQVGSDRTTVAGDEALLFIIADAINADGLFTPLGMLTEVRDAPAGATEPQLFVGRQTATGTTTSSRATPSVGCNVAYIHSIYRNNP